LIMLGRDLSLSTSSLADPVWDYVALGHIHRHQSLRAEGYPAVVYSGSLERIDFGEEGEEKGFCWVELIRGETRWSFVPVAARPFRTLHVDATAEEDPTQAVLKAVAGAEVEGAVVRVLVLLRADQSAALRDRDIHAALEGAAHVSLGRQVQEDLRARLPGMTPEGLTPLQLVEAFFQGRGEARDRTTTLLAHASDLMQESAGETEASGPAE
jgi:exonuclease SbcD